LDLTHLVTELTPTYSRSASFAAVVGAVMIGAGVIYLAQMLGASLAPGGWLRGSAPKSAAFQHAVARKPPLMPAIEPQLFEQLAPQQAVTLNAQVPISKLPNPAAAPFILPEVSPLDRIRAQTCLAMAIYYESANQGPDGEAAVAQVVLNRLRNPLFPKTVCGVVFQGSNLPTGCQFTFTCDGSLARPPSQAGWRDANEVARRALAGYVMKAVGEATHYHTIWVVPYWQSTVLKVAQLGAHIFYRWDGSLGAPGAFRGAYAGSEINPPLPAGLDKALTLPPSAQLIPLSQAERPMMTVAQPPAPVVAAGPETATATHGETLSGPITVATPLSDSYFSRDTPSFQHLPMH
jgi:spore germination cell wall hydrolase CwlJ-like protein